MACEYMVLWSKCLKGFLSFLRTRSSAKYHGAGIMQMQREAEPMGAGIAEGVVQGAKAVQY